MASRRVVHAGAILFAAAGLLRAQGDPTRDIQELARAVEQQLQEIDRLLLESGKKNQARQTPKELLQQARERSEAVEGGIDKLIEKLNEMKNQGGGGGGGPSDEPKPSDQDQPPGQPQQGQGGRNRRENQTPELVPRPQAQPQQGEQPQPGQGEPKPQPAGAQPQHGQENPDGGENARGNRPPESETGPANPGTGDGSWGELQPYMNFLKNRGSRPPAVPEKFRKYWEAYLKQKQGTGGGSGK
jgi:hypothetical protein